MNKKPVHAMLVHFPIALVATSFVADATFFFTRLPTLRDAGWWMLAAAGVTGIVTVLAGLYDMRRAPLSDAVHERVHQHMGVGLVLLAALLGLTVWRWTFHREPGAAPSAVYLDFAFLTVVLAAFQGWLGGELVYRHGVFVAREEPASDAGADSPAAEHHDGATKHQH